jgi:vanillate O-demethylase ferredoxin subunit
MKLRVRSITWEAEDTLSFELVDPAGAELPPVSAGAHLEVKVPGGLLRQYSLCDPPWQRDHYRIAVLDVAGGRGGSRAMHREVRAGQLVEIGGPRNRFELSSGAAHSLLLAGGIGITPILSMAEQLHRDGASFELHYCTRSPERTAFAQRLAAAPFASRVHLHHDGGDPARGLDIAALLARQAAGTHLYYCGPTGFMKAAQAAAAGWERERVHFEYFGADPSAAPAPRAAAAGNAAGGGIVVLKRSGREVAVGSGQSVLEALREAGVDCLSSCEAGVCGTCELKYLEGEPEHNDHVLSDEDRRHSLMICVALPGRKPLVLDL